MTLSHVAGDIVSSSMHDMLATAAHRAAVALSAVEKQGGNELRGQVDELVRRTLVASENAESSLTASPTLTISRQAIALVRGELISLASQNGNAATAADLANVLVLLDRVGNDQDQTNDNEFTRKLAGAEGVTAVMEIAHDMRSPLTSILFLVETLRRGRSGPVTGIQERQLGLIYGAALGLNTLACDVIDAVRGGQRLVDGRPIPFSVAEVILGVCDTVLPISEEKGIPIVHTLPAVDGRIGYPGALGRVLLNLLTNALKYTNEGTVTIGATEVGETRMSFWVSDTGQGIPPNVMSMLFDGFRPSASGMRFSNAGLGLAICQDFLRSMGTSLQVESSPDSGTRFSFDIDLWRA